MAVEVAPLAAVTTRMPLPVVCAPWPPTLVMAIVVLPAITPPTTTSRSDGEPSGPSTVFSCRRPPWPT